MKLIDRHTLGRLKGYAHAYPEIASAFTVHVETTQDRYYKHTKEWAEWNSEEARDEWLSKLDQ